MALASDTHDRIFKVADDLFEQSDRKLIPTVSAVREAAKADMNTTSQMMKIWRTKLASKSAPAPIAVPESIAQAGVAAIAALWQQAQALAAETLRAAQVAFEQERAEHDGERADLVAAFDRQADELVAVRETAKTAAAAQAALVADLRSQLDQSRQDAMQAHSELMEATAELRGELKAAQAHNATLMALLRERQPPIKT